MLLQTLVSLWNRRGISVLGVYLGGLEEREVVRREMGEGKGHIDERMCLRLNEKILGKKDKRWWEKRKKTKKI